MADYVLVHGGKENGIVWEKVVPLLEDQGHRVYTPSSSDPENSTLTEHISEVCRLLENEGLDDIILAGHSYASFIITGVTDRMPERIRRLVYIDSSVPAAGQSLKGVFDEVGITFEEFGVPEYPPFLEPLDYDEEKWRKVPKFYIHCTKSEFKAVGGPTLEKVLKNAKWDNWDYFQIDSDHKCMVSHPVELAEILLLDQ
ncbi:MAG: alpha/beta hydrolase [Actinomycetota bacterium]